MTSRSRVTTERISGRCTLTATTRPQALDSDWSTPGASSLSVALYTCPMDAAATGCANAVAASSKTSSSVTPSPKLASIVALASSLPKGAT